MKIDQIIKLIKISTILLRLAFRLTNLIWLPTTELGTSFDDPEINMNSFGLFKLG